MTRKEFEQYIQDLNLSPKLEKNIGLFMKKLIKRGLL